MLEKASESPGEKAPAVAAPAREHEDVQVLELGGRRLLLVGTAHISKESVDVVERLIREERPDAVCVELDERRYRALRERKKFSALDLKTIIRRKELSTLLVNLVLASYQKKLGCQLGVMPGAELLAAATAAEEQGVPVVLCDRDVRVTLRRAWYATSWYKRSYLLASLLASLFDTTEISEEKLSELRQKDLLSELLAEMGEAMPSIKETVIDERDIYLAEKIKEATGDKIVAVVGAGHVEGIRQALALDQRGRLEEISSMPPPSKFWKVLGWGIPALILGSLALIGFRHGSQAAGANLLFWVLANGIPAALGALLALAHPLTIASAFAAAPVTSLTPVIGAGYVTAFVQVMVRPPVVREFETALEDMASLGGWWRNKLLRVFLAFLLPGFGSMIGTWIGGVEIVSNLF